MRHVLFSVGGEACALPLQAVREVVLPPASWTRVPRAPRAVAGVMNLRGRVVLVARLDVLLEGQGAGDGAGGAERVLLLDRGRRDLGLLVGAVRGIEVLEAVVPLPGPPRACCRGLGQVNGRPVTVLDADALDGAVAALFDGPARRV